MNFKNIGLPAIILCVLCFCVSGLLALTNELTKDKIAQALVEKENQSRMVVMPEADSFEESGENIYSAKNGSDVIGYVFVTETNGYGGKIRVMTGIDNQKNITGIVILAQTETPGLGANCMNPSFSEMFIQSGEQALEVVKNTPSGDGKIEAMTGATITTKAVTSAVNEAISLFDTVGGAK